MMRKGRRKIKKDGEMEKEEEVQKVGKEGNIEECR